MKRTLPVMVVGLGLLLLLGSGWILLETRNPVQNSPLQQLPRVRLPAEIAGLQLTQQTSGKAALAEIAQMHGREFPVSSGSIGIYGDRQVMLWVAGTDSSALAAQMVTAMHDRIAEGNSPFTPTSQVQRGKHMLYGLEGMGQTHYYFQSGNLVIWLAVDPALADQSIQQVLEVYP